MKTLPEGTGYFTRSQYSAGLVSEIPGAKLERVRKSDKIRSEYIAELFSFKLGEQNDEGNFPVLSHNRIFFRVGSEEGKKFEIKIIDLDDSQTHCHLKMLDEKGNELPNLPKSLPVLRRVGENLIRIDALYTWLEQRNLSLS